MSGKKRKNKQVQQIKKLEELKFDSLGDEYLYLHNFITESQCSELLVTEDGSELTIDDLRQIYQDIVSINELDIKYQNSKRYWFPEQDAAVVNFNKTSDKLERDSIFLKMLYKPLNKLIENIIFTYKLYRTDISVKDLQAECLSFLMEKIAKFKPEYKTSAFSYLGTIAKHWLQGDKRVSHKRSNQHTDIDENIDRASERPENIYHIDGQDDKDINFLVFESILKMLENEMDKPKLLGNDKKVAEAIITIFHDAHFLESLNKNYIYFLLRERTGLEGKEVAYSITRIRNFYKSNKGNIIKKII